MQDCWIPSPEQEEILRLNSGRHLVLAPPGTGKTALLAWRVRDALRAGIPPERMLCLTFTVRAADEMKQRIRLAVPNARLPELGNFHHWCNRFLHNRQLVPCDCQIVDEILQADLMSEAIAAVAAKSALLSNQIDALRDRTGQLPVKALLSHAACSRQRDWQFPPDVLRIPHNNRFLDSASPDLLKRLTTQYHQIKKDLHLLDYDDLLLYAYDFVAIKKVVPDCDKCTWVQIDEVQDLNPLEWGLVRALSAPHAHQVFFGDGEQSIFSFLGADSPHLSQIEASCDGTHSLPHNYRSRSYLLDMSVRYALQTLHADWDVLPMPEIIEPPDKKALRLTRIPQNESPEEWIAKGLRLAQEERPAFPRTAILVRTNRQADDFESALRAVGLPVYKVSGTDWTTRPETRDFKAFLAVLVKHDDRMAWARLFRLFANIPSQATARKWIAEFFEFGLRPSDLFESEQPDIYHTPLDTLCQTISGSTPTRVVVFDTETTGRDPDSDDIIQLAALEVVDGHPGQSFNRYLLTNRDLSDTESIHHISRDFLDAHGVPPPDALRDFLDFVGDSPLSGHNAWAFDRAFLSAALRRHGLPPLSSNTVFIDTLDASRRLFPNLKSYKLADLIKVFKLAGVNSHNAADDVAATAELLLHLANTAHLRADTRRTFLRDNADIIFRFRNAFLPLWTSFVARPDHRCDFRFAWSTFLDAALDASASREDIDFDSRDEMDRAADKFLRYAEHAWGNDCKQLPFLDILRRENRFLSRCKEVDLLVGDEPIVVSTVHKAKGLEFPRVIVPDAQDGTYPHSGEQDEESRLESARILYVAMTRAQNMLVLLYSNAPSPFLEPVMACFNSPPIPDLYIRLREQGQCGLGIQHPRPSPSVSLASDPDWLARCYYIASAIRSRTAIPELPALLGDKDPTVRSFAVKLSDILRSRP